MEMILLNRGYKKVNNLNEYVRGDWTVRFDNENIEVFNDPDKMVGKYFVGPIDKVDIEQLLDEIDDFNC